MDLPIARNKQLVYSIALILDEYDPIGVYAMLKSGGISSGEAYEFEAMTIAAKLAVTDDVFSLQKRIYNLFVKEHEYAVSQDKIDIELLLLEKSSAKDGSLEHVDPGKAGTVEDYFLIAQEIYKLKTSPLKKQNN